MALRGDGPVEGEPAARAVVASGWRWGWRIWRRCGAGRQLALVVSGSGAVPTLKWRWAAQAGHDDSSTSLTGFSPFCYIPLVPTWRCVMGKPKETREAKVFWTGRSQAVRLPQEFRFDGETVLVHREGDRVVLEAAEGWPAGYLESFRGVDADLERPDQGSFEPRETLG